MEVGYGIGQHAMTKIIISEGNTHTTDLTRKKKRPAGEQDLNDPGQKEEPVRQ